MQTIRFNRFVFHGGVNVTVRRGSKTYPADVLLVSNNTTDRPIRARVLNDKRHVCRFCDIPARIIELEHDPDCRTYSGLLRAMEEAYPGFKPDEQVTCVILNVEEDESWETSIE